ncbi:MAG: YfjI family protein [Methylococcales bacterium]
MRWENLNQKHRLKMVVSTRNIEMNLPNRDRFPVEYLPPLIKNAVLEMRDNTKFPLPLIVSSALGAISLACQNSIDVRLPMGSVSPCSLFMLLVADSGEGKTPVDHYFTQPISDFEENEARKLKDELVQQKTHRSVWAIEHKEIEVAIKKNRKKNLSSDDPEQLDLLNAEFENLKQKLEGHLLKELPAQRKYKLIFSNTTPAKIALDLHENWLSAGLISDEAGSLFRGRAMNDLGMLNQLWDGSTLSVDRVSSPSFKVKDARLTISLMVQGKILDDYVKGRGKNARDIGFIARCLVAFPFTTKGSRVLNNQPQSWIHLTKFQQRITEILTQDKLDVDQGRQTRPILEFSQEAKNYWFTFRNDVEWDIKTGRYFSDVDDGASKISTNLARMAALFHFFEGRQGDIIHEAEYEAEEICSWYMHEFKRLFTKNPAIPIEVSDAAELEQCLLRWCQNHSGMYAIEKRKIAQYAPNQLRNNKLRRDDALSTLISQNKIRIELDEKTQCVLLNPNFFPVPRDYESLFPRRRRL